MYLNEATLLNNVRRRYKKDHIYVLKISHFLSFESFFFLLIDLCGKYFNCN